MEITAQSRLFDVLEAFPALEDQIVHIAPPFKNLKNPVLRRTVGKLATLAKVAQVGGMDERQLVNILRRAVGQPELAVEAAPRPMIDIQRSGDDPDWIAGEPQFTVDGTELLGRGEVPLSKVNELLGELAEGQYILLSTDFEPTPIVDAMRKQNRQVFHKTSPQQPGQHLTFIG